MDNNKFEKFLKDSISQKELSLVLANTDDELVRTKDELAGRGYIFPTDTLSTISDLNIQSKICFELKDESESKKLYDLALQYPTGQINLFDEKRMKNIVATPDYNNKSVILLITDNQLKKLQSINFDFSAVTGIAYRNKG